MTSPRDPILVINAGSSSIKFSVFETAADRSLSAGAHGEIESIGASARLRVTDAGGVLLADKPVGAAHHGDAIGVIHDWFTTELGGEAGFGGVGHRVVHGGPDYSEAVLVDERVLAALERLAPLAPLHQSHNIAAIRAVHAAAPGLRQVACFDTAFHHDQPAVARSFALPRELTAKGVRRYGFHGLSYEYIVSALPRVAPGCVEGRVVVAHLGNGASMCAIHHGRSMANTMGLTAVDGLPMGTRSGALDPGVLLYLMQNEGMDAEAIEHLIYERSGLLGVSGISGDVRTLLASDAPSAMEALELFVYQVGRALGSLAAAMGGVDALVFTGGIGEHAESIRASVCSGAAWLGVELDPAANRGGGPRISTARSAVSAWVIPTDENLMIARHTRRLLDAPPP